MTKGSLTLKPTINIRPQGSKRSYLTQTISSIPLALRSFSFSMYDGKWVFEQPLKNSCQLLRLSIAVTQNNSHGVNAPGTANKTIFLLAAKSLMLILLAGESSNNSTDGILSPSWKQSAANQYSNALRIDDLNPKEWLTQR